MASSSSSSAAAGDVAESSAAGEAAALAREAAAAESSAAVDVAESSAAGEAAAVERETAAESSAAGDVAESSAAGEAAALAREAAAESSAAGEALALAGEVSTLAVAESSGKKIILMSSDGELFVIDEAAAVQSQMLKNMIDDDCAGSAIPLPNVTARILTKVVEWCERHVEATPKPEVEPGDKAAEKAAADLKAWDAEYVKVDKGTLYQLILAANYLNIKGLMDLTCMAVADMIRGKSTDEIRTILGIKNTYTKEEEEEVRRENAWAFE